MISKSEGKLWDVDIKNFTVSPLKKIKCICVFPMQQTMYYKKTYLLSGCKVGHVVEGHGIVWPHLVVVGLVSERQWEHSLLLEIGLVNASEGLGDDGVAPEKAGLEGGVLARAALAVVLVADDHPLQAGVAVLLRDLGNGALPSRHVILHLRDKHASILNL